MEDVRPLKVYRVPSAFAVLLVIWVVFPIYILFTFISKLGRLTPNAGSLSLWILIPLTPLLALYAREILRRLRHAREVRFMANGTVEFRMAFWTDCVDPLTIRAFRPVRMRRSWVAIEHDHGRVFVSQFFPEMEGMLDSLMRMNPSIDDQRGAKIEKTRKQQFMALAFVLALILAIAVMMPLLPSFIDWLVPTPHH